MSEAKPPAGELFSRVYIERSQALRDSERFRERLIGFYFKHIHEKVDDFASLIRRESGARVPIGTYGYMWFNFFQQAELRDILDSITLGYRALRAKSLLYDADQWLDNAARIIREENLGYRLDEAGGVHLAVDKEFEHSRAATLAGLGAPRYKGALAAFNEAYRCFDEVPPDTKGAVRALFEAVEIVFKLICPGGQRLGTTEITHNLLPVVQGIYKADATALLAATPILNSIGKWVVGVHFYRHGQTGPEPAAPPLEVAVLERDEF